MNKYQIGWLKLLRDPDAKQAAKAFKTIIPDADDGEPTLVGYCCLGLYAEQYVVGADEDTWEWSDNDYDDDGTEIVKYNLSVCSSTELPDEHLLLLGLTTYDTNWLASLNDDWEFTFLDIANVLEHVFRDGSIDVATAVTELYPNDGIRFTNDFD